MRRSEGFTGTLIVILLGTAFSIGGLVGGIIGGGLALWAFAPRVATPPAVAIAPTATPTLFPTATATPEVIPSPTPTPVVVATPSTADVVETVMQSVVTIANQKHTLFGADGTRTVGSGVVVDAAGYIITNGHVVADAAELTATLFDGTKLPAKLVVYDANQDLALLKVATDVPLVPARWGDSNTVRLGQSVLALGSPLGDFPNSVTMGIVSGLDRALSYDDAVLFGLIQTDAAINTGNSGGPLINLHGDVIGINTFIIRGERGQNVAEGIGFAIPASSAKLLSSTWMADISPNSETPPAAPANSEPLPAAQPDTQ